MNADERGKMAKHPAYDTFGLDQNPEIAFLGVKALRELADFCESYQVDRLRQAGHSWARMVWWAGVSSQALHKKHADAKNNIQEASQDL
jgi:hypothetical protein